MQGDSLYKSIINEEKPNTFYSLLRVLLRIFDNFFHDNCFIRASGLAFNTLLALVPLSAIILAFGGFSNMGNEIQNFLMGILLPSSLNQILDAIGEFTDNSMQLGTYGIIFFLITILFLMNNIEGNLNAIWHCQRKRSFFQQFTIYTTVIVFSSLLIGGNFSITGNILAIIPDYSQAIKEPFLVKALDRAFSITFITLTFMILILLVPSTKVAFKSALTGALTGAVIWEVAKWGFKEWANNSVRNSVIYGALFLIPLLLIWLYVVWLIIMIAMETAFVHQHRHDKHTRYNEEKSPSSLFHTSLDLYLRIAFTYLDGTDKATVNDFSSETDDALTILIHEELIFKSEEGEYFPATAPEKTLFSHIIGALSGLDKSEHKDVVAFLEGGGERLKEKSISELFRELNEEQN